MSVKVDKYHDQVTVNRLRRAVEVLAYSTVMEIVHLALRYLHLIGFAMILGGWLVAFLARRYQVNPAMLWGTAIQLVTGIILSAPLPTREIQPDGAKLGVKLVLALALAVMVWIPHLKKRESSSKGHFIGIGALAALTAGVATFWT